MQFAHTAIRRDGFNGKLVGVRVYFYLRSVAIFIGTVDDILNDNICPMFCLAPSFSFLSISTGSPSSWSFLLRCPLDPHLFAIGTNFRRVDSLLNDRPEIWNIILMVKSLFLV